MQTFKMLRKNGTGVPFPYNQHLASSEGMVVVEMTATEISACVGKPQEQIKEEKLHMSPIQKPGPGWVRNHSGTWTRKKTKLL